MVPMTTRRFLLGTGDSLDGSYDDPEGVLLGSGDDSLDGPDDDPKVLTGDFTRWFL